MMNVRRKDTLTQSIAPEEIQIAELCRCLPPSSLQVTPTKTEEKENLDPEKVTPISARLHVMLRSRLDSFFPRSTPLSLILLHISQLEQVQFIPQSLIMHKRQRYHASASLLEQVLANIQRTMRRSDLILTDEGRGAALIFPDVDEQGIYGMMERIYRNISLIQAETVIPPLKRETNIVLGVGTYQHPGSSVEHLLYYASITARRFNLRPAIMTPLWNTHHSNINELASTECQPDTQDRIPVAIPVRPLGSAPFMQLPKRVPPRLRQLVPHHLASELQCAPVGRDHLCLTVAMADPQDGRSVRFLETITGLTIFPVSCDITALQTILEEKW
jgi:hypothetical protein